MSQRNILQTDFSAILTENDVEGAYDGGRVVLTAQTAELQKRGIQQVTVLVNYTTDDPMHDWPTTRQERESRRFRITVAEDT
jgi:hypothetical protein